MAEESTGYIATLLDGHNVIDSLPNATPYTGSLSPLPDALREGLIPVATFGILSFSAAIILFLLLSYRLIVWTRKSPHVNQFILLLWNLLLADVQQSLAFLINAQWLVHDGVEVGTTSCWAQGWFVSTGDMASGIWSFAIGLHTFAAIIFDYRPSNASFILGVVFIWTFVYGTAVAGIAMQPDLYVRAVAWCWINAKYGRIRFWLHYFWIFTFEFGTVLVYGVLILALRWRIRSNYYQSEQKNRSAKEAGKLMIAYPVIYILCTLPLATLRMISINRPHERVAYGWFCLAGAMITSNGWLDVLMYCLTRRVMLFSDDPPAEDNGTESFQMPWAKSSIFGNQTTCEHVDASHYPMPKLRKHRSADSDTIFMIDRQEPYQQAHKNDLLSFTSITTERTIKVTSAPMTGAEQRALQNESKCGAPRSFKSDASSSKGLSSRPTTSHSFDYDIESLDFKTKPAGL